MRTSLWTSILTASLCLTGGVACAQDDLPKQALAVFKTHCFKCHAEGGNEGGFGYIDDLAKLVEKKKIAPANLAQSRILTRIAKGEMPPEGEEPAKRRPTEAEIKTLEAWIQAGAKPPGAPVKPAVKRERFTLADELRLMRDHLLKVDEEDRPFQRFFTLRNVNNTPTRTAEELDFHRAAFGKALNSLSYRQRLIVPRKLDAVGVLYAVDLRKDLDWGHAKWQKLLAAYPYGLSHDYLPDDEAINKLAREIYKYSGTQIPALRIDWFISRATRPPLYHDLLDIPQTDMELERRLGVHVLKNLLDGNVRRAGMINSGISGQHRMIERHDATNGYYWKSYDFKPGNDKSDLTRFPLGPVFDQNPYPNFAFTHDGGEIIFRLPNGLQGYMLTNAKGTRIDDGPTDVVSDRTQISGDVRITNGVSCMACHTQGMKTEFEDVVRAGTAVKGGALEAVRRIYAKADDIQQDTLQDQELFRDAVVRAMKGMTEDDSQLKTEDGNVLEPIGPLSYFYNLHPMGLEELAGELDMDPAALQQILKIDDRFAELGLGTIASGQSRIKRADWEKLETRVSPFQRAANLLNLGTPKVFISR